MDKKIIPIDETNFHLALLLLEELNAGLSADEIRNRFIECCADNYVLLAWMRSGDCVAIAGYSIETKIYSGRFMYVDNFCVAASARSSGLGKIIIEYLEEIGRQKGCLKCVLDTYTSNTKSHKFYHREGYEIWGFHFVKSL